MILASWASVMLIARLVGRSWWAPGAFLSLVLGGSAIATTLFAPEYHMSLGANLMLQAFALALLLGGAFASVLPLHPRSHALPTLRRTRAFFLFGLSAALIGLLATMSSLGITASAFLDFGEFASLAQTATRQRYVEGVEMPLYGNIASACILAYVAVLVIDIVATNRFRIILTLPIAIYILTNAIVTTRSTLVYLLITALLAYAYAYAIKNRQSSLRPNFPAIFRRRTLLLALGVAAALVAIFVAFQMLRFGQSHARPVGEVLEYIRKWPWGSLPGFSMWWDGLAPAEASHLPGYYTFMGVFDNLGIEPRTQGGYSGFVYLTGSEPGNIYTSFRGVLHDFGIVGGLFFLALLGFVGGAAYYGAVFPAAVRMAAFFLVYMWLATSFIVSYWAFTGNVIAAILTPVVLWTFSSTRQNIRGSVNAN